MESSCCTGVKSCLKNFWNYTFKTFRDKRKNKVPYGCCWDLKCTEKLLKGCLKPFCCCNNLEGESRKFGFYICVKIIIFISISTFGISLAIRSEPIDSLFYLTNFTLWAFYIVQFIQVINNMYLFFSNDNGSKTSRFLKCFFKHLNKFSYTLQGFLRVVNVYIPFTYWLLVYDYNDPLKWYNVTNHGVITLLWIIDEIISSYNIDAFFTMFFYFVYLGIYALVTWALTELGCRITNKYGEKTTVIYEGIVDWKNVEMTLKSLFKFLMIGIAIALFEGVCDFVLYISKIIYNNRKNGTDEGKETEMGTIESESQTLV